MLSISRSADHAASRLESYCSCITIERRPYAIIGASVVEQNTDEYAMTSFRIRITSYLFVRLILTDKGLLYNNLLSFLRLAVLAQGRNSEQRLDSSSTWIRAIMGNESCMGKMKSKT